MKSFPLQTESPKTMEKNIEAFFLLTKSEVEVIEGMSLGKRIKLIAYELNVSQGAIKQRLKKAKKKLNAATAQEACTLYTEIVGEIKTLSTIFNVSQNAILNNQKTFQIYSKLFEYLISEDLPVTVVEIRKTAKLMLKYQEEGMKRELAPTLQRVIKDTRKKTNTLI